MVIESGQNRWVSYRKLWLCALILPFLKPYNVTLIPIIDGGFKILKLAASVYIVCSFFQKPHLHTESVYLLLFCFVWGLSLIVNTDRSTIIDYGNNILSIVVICLLFERNFFNEEFKRDISNILYCIGAVYFILNLITAVQGYPFGAGDLKIGDNANFLGGDNYSAFILICFNGFMFFYDDNYLGRIRVRTWIFSVLGLCSLIIPFSFAGILGYLLFLVLAGFNRFRVINKILNWKSVIVVCLVMVLFVSYSNLDQLFGKLLTSMGKSGFNGRNMIWPMSIAAICKKPLIGYGGLTEEQAKTWMIAGANHTHNIILQYPFSVGIIGSSFILLFFYTVLKGTSINRNKQLRMLLFSFAAYLFCSIFDFYIGLIYFYILLEMILVHKEAKPLPGAI